MPPSPPRIDQRSTMGTVRLCPWNRLREEVVNGFLMQRDRCFLQSLPLSFRERFCGRLNPSSLPAGEGGNRRVGQIRQGGKPGAQDVVLLMRASGPNIGRHARSGSVESLKR